MKTIMIVCMVPDERSDMALLEAHKLGYRTVFCSDVENQHTRDEADAYYVVDWNDTETYIKIAQEEKIGGIVGLSDSAMLPVARVTERLHLPGSPESSMISKHAFRDLQKCAGDEVFCPAYFVTDSVQTALQNIEGVHFPVIIKPVLCGASYGQTVINSAEELPSVGNACV
ncbi:MAG: hypothetical protein IJS09_02890 [Treponema sp.]|nr:hypothetical protein [Treponema sp.]